jgi:hypothetical protein
VTLTRYSFLDAYTPTLATGIVINQITLLGWYLLRGFQDWHSDKEDTQLLSWTNVLRTITQCTAHACGWALIALDFYLKLFHQDSQFGELSKNVCMLGNNYLQNDSLILKSFVFHIIGSCPGISQ